MMATASKLRPAPPDLPAALTNVVEYRKSGLSLNHVVGCPLDCGYCVRHLFGNFAMKRPHQVMPDEQAVEALLGHWAFRAHQTPIQIFNRATDPLLPVVKEHLHHTLALLDSKGLTNHVLVITRWKVLAEDVERFNLLRNLKITVLVTWSGIDDRRIEPVDSAIAERSLDVLSRHAKRARRILYWRPLIAGINTSDTHIDRARELAKLADATVFTGLFHRQEILDHFRSIGLPDLYDEVSRRKILPREVEEHVITRFGDAPLFRKTSCGVAFAHGLSDYNGHYGVPEICDICPAPQVAICAGAHRRPDPADVWVLAGLANLEAEEIRIEPGRLIVDNSNEQQRYFMQHALGFQVQDRALPHLPGRHGRAEKGWGDGTAVGG